MVESKSLMTEKILKIDASEITTVRLICKGKNCGSAMDIPLSALTNAPLQCPGCGKAHRRPDVEAYLKGLVDLVYFFQKHGDLGLQFVLPFPD